MNCSCRIASLPPRQSKLLRRPGSRRRIAVGPRSYAILMMKLSLFHPGARDWPDSRQRTEFLPKLDPQIAALSAPGCTQLVFLGEPCHVHFATLRYWELFLAPDNSDEIGRASCRERV